jgi:outer membrane lipoprotein-sorting protein
MSKLTLLLLLALPACTSQEQMAERHAAIVQAQANAMSQIENHCTSIGLTTGSGAYVDCLRDAAKDRGLTLVESGKEKQITVVSANIGFPYTGGSDTQSSRNASSHGAPSP